MIGNEYIRNKTATLCDYSLNEIKEMQVDVQPYSRVYLYDNGFKLTMSNKIFTPRDEEITELSYFLINGVYHKVILIDCWTDHYVCYCYKCEVIGHA